MILENPYATAHRRGGTNSGEHGIGPKRARYLPLVMDDRLTEVQRPMKRTFDPLSILNPGKIPPPERTP